MSERDAYAHLDIDQMSGRQLHKYGLAVTADAIKLLEANGEMLYKDLVDKLVIGALGSSEIAFGLMVGREYMMLEWETLAWPRVVRIKRKENEQQPEG